jgi:hypothetical protein
MSPELVVVRTRNERQLSKLWATCSFEHQYTVPSKCQAVRAKELEQTSLQYSFQLPEAGEPLSQRVGR